MYAGRHIVPGLSRCSDHFSWRPLAAINDYAPDVMKQPGGPNTMIESTWQTREGLNIEISNVRATPMVAPFKPLLILTHRGDH